MQPERYVERHIVTIGNAYGRCLAGMSLREEYLLRAAELSARAQVEGEHGNKNELEILARAYLRLAEQAERNSLIDIVYQTPPDNDPAQTGEAKPAPGRTTDNGKE